MANVTSLQTFDHFNKVLYWPHVITYLVYLTQKTLLMFALCFHFVLNQYQSRKRRDSGHEDCGNTGKETTIKQYKYLQCFDLLSILILLVSCCYGCLCCCACCGSECCGSESCGEKISDCFTSFVYKNRTKFDRWVVNIFLGKEDRIVSRVNDYKLDTEDELKVPHLYIRNHQLHHIDIRVLTLIVISFGLLTVGSVWNTFIFNVTHICTDDHPNIYCFALPSEYGSNIDVSKERITNCSYWSHSNEVQFTCFQYAYNMQGALATFGGLLALFQLAMTIITSVLLALIDCIISCAGQNKEGIYERCKSGIKIFRFIISIVIGLTEISVAIFITAALPKIDEENVSLVIGFLQHHGDQVLLIIAIIGTIPLLPLEEYYTPQVDADRSIVTDESSTHLLNQTECTKYHETV